MRGGFWRYLLLQSKRTVRNLGRIMAFVCALLVALGAVAMVMQTSHDSAENRQFVSVGVVGAADDPLMKIVFTVLEDMDEARFTVSFRRCESEEEAGKLVEQGEINAYLLIPDDFSHAFLYGEDKKLTYVLDAGAVSMGAALTREVFAVLSSYVTETKTGIFAACRYAEDMGYTADEVDALNLDMTMAYMMRIAERNALAAVEELGVGGLSMGSYYLCGMTVVFLMLLGIACCQLRVRRNDQLPRLLSCRGVGAFGQVTAEYLPQLLLSVLSLAIPAVIVGLVAQKTVIPLKEIEYWILADYLRLVMRMLPAVFALTALQFVLYEAVSGTVSSLLLQFGVTAVLCYICGCFYPLSFFPETVQKIASVLPARLCFTYMEGLITGQASAAALLGCLVWGVTMLTLTVCIRQLRLQKEGV